MNIQEFLLKYPYLKQIYKVLKPFLPEKIEIYKLKEIERFGFKLRDTVDACVLQPDKLFFKHFPPDEIIFAHELIHLCKKPNDIHEEVYRYNLASVVVFMAEEGIKTNPFKLFHLSEDEVTKVLNEFGYKDIDDFYTMQGVIPYTHEISLDGIYRSKNYSSKDVVIAFITELSAGIAWDSTIREILKKLLTLGDKHGTR